MAAIKAIAVLAANELNITGHVLFTEDRRKKETIITVHFENVPGGKHGFHIHTLGDLRAGCDSLCAHYNPHNQPHGGRDSEKRHVGDLGNVEPNQNGVVHKVMRDKQIKLRGKYSVVGRSIVLHDGEDDLGTGTNAESKKTGNAGKRIACGIIGYRK